MYKVIGFKEAVATRKVFLLNEETGTQEVRKLAKVQVGQDVYYIPEGELKDIGDVDVIYYSSSRRDLIQVDNVLHANCHNPIFAD